MNIMSYCAWRHSEDEQKSAWLPSRDFMIQRDVTSEQQDGGYTRTVNTSLTYSKLKSKFGPAPITLIGLADIDLFIFFYKATHYSSLAASLAIRALTQHQQI